VTSVLQTTAGKMIFGRYDDRQQNAGQDRPVSVQKGSGGHTHPAPKIEQAAGR
jgi:hypothetical protein